MLKPRVFSSVCNLLISLSGVQAAKATPVAGSGGGADAAPATSRLPPHRAPSPPGGASGLGVHPPAGPPAGVPSMPASSGTHTPRTASGERPRLSPLSSDSTGGGGGSGGAGAGGGGGSGSARMLRMGSGERQHSGSGGGGGARMGRSSSGERQRIGRLSTDGGRMGSVTLRERLGSINARQSLDRIGSISMFAREQLGRSASLLGASVARVTNNPATYQSTDSDLTRLTSML